MHYVHYVSVRDYANLATLIATWKPRGRGGVAACTSAQAKYRIINYVPRLNEK